MSKRRRGVRMRVGRGKKLGAVRMMEEGVLVERLGLGREMFRGLRRAGLVVEGVHWGRVRQMVCWSEDGIKAAEHLLGIRCPVALGGSGVVRKDEEGVRRRVGEVGDEGLRVVSNELSVMVEEEGKEEVVGVLRANWLNRRIVTALRGNGEEVRVRVRDADQWGSGKARNGGMKGMVVRWEGGIWREVVVTSGVATNDQVRRWRKGLDGLKVGDGGSLVMGEK